MRRIAMFFFVSILYFQTFAQNNTFLDWKTDLDTLQNRLLSKDYLFYSISKNEFKNQINQLKSNVNLQSKAQTYWELKKIIHSFKEINLTVAKENYTKFPFEIACFKKNYYVLKTHADFEFILAKKLLAINEIPIDKIVQRIKNSIPFSPKKLAYKSLLEFLDISKTDTLKLTLLCKDKKKLTVKIPFIQDFDEADLLEIIPLKTPFYKEKKNRWFWMYGINFGQQIFFKYNVGLSNEYFIKMKDSLGWTALDCAKKYDMRLQSVYDAPKFSNFTKNLVRKFNKKRYKKLFIDLRGNKKGNILALQSFIDKIKNIKRINKRNRIYLLVDKTIHSSGIKAILAFKKQTKAIVIGEKFTGTINDTDKMSSFYLPNSRFKISYPLLKLETITIKPKILVEYTIHHYINGIDPILQKVLEQ